MKHLLKKIAFCGILLAAAACGGVENDASTEENTSDALAGDSCVDDADCGGGTCQHDRVPDTACTTWSCPVYYYGYCTSNSYYGNGGEGGYYSRGW